MTMFLSSMIVSDSKERLVMLYCIYHRCLRCFHRRQIIS